MYSNEETHPGAYSGGRKETKNTPRVLSFLGEDILNE
jgi:hypothetical protein